MFTKNNSWRFLEDNGKKVLELLKVFNILEIKDKYPAEISGGQKQRVAVARAMMNEPALVLADEPTGNLDSNSSQSVIDAFISARDTLGATILMVTHDIYAASYSDRVLLLQDGTIYKSLIKQENQKMFMERLFSESKNGGIKMSYKSIYEKLRKYNRAKYRQLEICLIIAIVFVTSFSIILFGPIVQQTFPEGGDSRKQIYMIYVATLIGCWIFTVYSLALFLNIRVEKSEFN